MLGRDGHFTHEGQPIRHKRLRGALERSVRYLDDEAAWVVKLGRFRGRIEIEDAPFFVETFDPETGAIALSDRSEEPLAADTVEVRDGEVLYCQVKGRFAARFTRTAQAALLQALDLGPAGRPVLRIGPRTVPLAGLGSIESE